MNAINERLTELERQGKPVTVGLVGAGQMGQEILCTARRMKGLRVAVVVDVTFERAQLAMRMAGVDDREVVCTNDPGPAERALEAGRIVAASDWRLAVALGSVQVLVDATGSPELGVLIAWAAFGAQKHIVMMNVECDMTVGSILKRQADEAGVIYTLAAGDEPAAILELYRFATALGF